MNAAREDGDAYFKDSIGSDWPHPPGLVLLNAEDAIYKKCDQRQNQSCRIKRTAQTTRRDIDIDEYQGEDGDDEQERDGEYPLTIDLHWKDIRKVTYEKFADESSSYNLNELSNRFISRCSK